MTLEEIEEYVANDERVSPTKVKALIVERDELRAALEAMLKEILEPSDGGGGLYDACQRARSALSRSSK